MTLEVAKASQVPLNSALVVEQSGKDYLIIAHSKNGYFAFIGKCPVDNFKLRICGQQISCATCDFNLDGEPTFGKAKAKNIKLNEAGKVVEVNGTLYLQK